MEFNPDKLDPAERYKLLIGCIVPRPIALVSTILQLPVGMWVLATMSQVSREALMGNRPLASLLFLAGVLLAVLLIGRLLAVVLGEVRLKEIRRAGWL